MTNKQKYLLSVLIIVAAIVVQMYTAFGAYIGDPYITTITPPSMATTTRALNTAYQISTTNLASVTYGVDVAATLNLSGGQTGTVVLEYADDIGFTSGVTTIQSATNGNTGTLSLGLNLTQTTTATLTGYVPVGKYVRLRTVNTTGTPVFTFRTGQEVVLYNINI